MYKSTGSKCKKYMKNHRGEQRYPYKVSVNKKQVSIKGDV